MEGASTYKHTMDTLCFALSSASTIIAVVSPADLRKIQNTLEQADSLGAILYPSEYKAASDAKTLEHQRKLLKWAKQTIVLFDELSGESPE